jgi:hypothetical protein
MSDSLSLGNVRGSIITREVNLRDAGGFGISEPGRVERFVEPDLTPLPLMDQVSEGG